MKKLSYIIIIMLSCYQLAAQTIVDISAKRTKSHYKNGDFYLKDVQNLFQPYLGTWKYTDGNNEFRITITKVTMFHISSSDSNYYTDGLLVNYQKYINGTMIFQSPPDDYPGVIIKEFGKLRFTFVDYERIYKHTVLNLTRNAWHDAFLNLIPNNTGNYNLHFKLYTERTGTGLEYEPVQSGNPYHSTPTDIIMTKM
ncbi:MAG: DUF6705 family protein [Bacteroidota bacterium]